MSTRFLNNININDSYTLPAADGTADQVISTDGAGQLSFIDQTTLSAESAEVVKVPVKNLQGSALTKGDPVYISGSVGTSGRLEVKLADAGDTTKMPALGLLQQDLVINGEGYVVVTGKLRNLVTSPIDGATPSEGDVVYVKSGGTTGAALTTTKPVGVNLIQNMGKVGRVSTANDGTFVVSSILRSNDVPTPLYIDHANQRLGIGTANPNFALDVNGTIRTTGSLLVGPPNNTITGFNGLTSGENNNISGELSVAFGFNNIVTGNRCGGLGANNIVAGGQVWATGDGNDVGIDKLNVGGNIVTAGFNNTVKSGNSCVVGSGNNLTNTQELQTRSTNFVLGSKNDINDGARVFMLGSSNTSSTGSNDVVIVGRSNTASNGRAYAFGDTNVAAAFRAFAIGAANTTASQSSLLIGANNASGGGRNQYVLGRNNNIIDNPSNPGIFPSNVVLAGVGNNTGYNNSYHFGRGMSSGTNTQVLIGHFAETSTKSASYVGIGVGSSGANRLTAMSFKRSSGTASTADAQIFAEALYNAASYADDAAAAAGGVELGQLYRAGSTVKIRMT